MEVAIKKKDYWIHSFVKDNVILSWDEAMSEFVGATGQTGTM